jgi:hypothetical protein
MGPRTFSGSSSTFFPTYVPEGPDMELLLCVAWGAGIASLCLVADMISSDLASRRRERLTVARDWGRR